MKQGLAKKLMKVCFD